MWYVEYELPESIFDVAYGGEAFTEVDRPALCSEPIEDVNELAMCLVRNLVFAILRAKLEEHVSFIVAFKWPMVLIEASNSNLLAIIDLYSFHVEVLEGLFCDLGSILL